MNFFKLIFLPLIGSFFIQVNALQINHQQKPSVQIPQQKSTTCIKAIIFDYDGTLINTEITYFLEWQHVLRCQGYELNEDKFWDFVQKNNLVGSFKDDEMILKYCCELLGRDCASEMLKEKKAFSTMIHQTDPFPAIEPTVRFLQALGKEKIHLGLKIGLASSNAKERILRNLKRLNVTQYFDVIVSADDLENYTDPEGTKKPKPYVYQQACKLLELCPKQCVAIEDSPAGISSAISAGCIAVAIPTQHTASQNLSHANLKIDSLEGLTPTDFLCIIANLKVNK